jgi:hypothetical protein
VICIIIVYWMCHKKNVSVSKRCRFISISMSCDELVYLMLLLRGVCVAFYYNYHFDQSTFNLINPLKISFPQLSVKYLCNIRNGQIGSVNLFCCFAEITLGVAQCSIIHHITKQLWLNKNRFILLQTHTKKLYPRTY